MSESLKLLKEWASGNAPDMTIRFLTSKGESTTDFTKVGQIEFSKTDGFKKVFNASDATRYKTYTLLTVVFFLSEYCGPIDWQKGKNSTPLQQGNVALNKYMQEAEGKSMETVRFLDFRDLLGYLTTDQATSANLEHVEKEKQDVTMGEEGSVQEEIEFMKRQASRERVINSRKTIMTLRPGNNKSFDNVRKMAETFFLAKTHAQQNSKQPSKPTSTTISSRKRPIILLPPTTTTIVQMYNVLSLLENQHFVPPTTFVNDASGPSVKPTKVEVKHTFAGSTSPTTFIVTDNPATLIGKELKSTADWDEMVVAVFVSGHPWQLDSYPPKNGWREPASLFGNKVLGVYWKYADEGIPTGNAVSSWNLWHGNIQRTRRHQDAMVVQDFWEKLGAWMKTHGRGSLIQ